MQLVNETNPDAETQAEIRYRQKRFELAEVLRGTETILHLAQKGDWEAVEELERMRKSDIAVCFSGLDVLEMPLLKEALGTLASMNDQIMELVAQARQESLQACDELRKARQATNDYQAQHGTGELAAY